MSSQDTASMRRLHDRWAKACRPRPDVSAHRREAAAAMYLAASARLKRLFFLDIIAEFEAGRGAGDTPHVFAESLASPESMTTLAAEIDLLLRTAIDFAPSFGEAVYDLAVLERRAGKLDVAGDLFGRAATLAPHPKASGQAPLKANALWERARIMERLGNTARAEKLYREAVELLSTFGVEHRAFALRLHRNGKIDEALSHYDRTMAYSHRYAPEVLGQVFGAEETPPVGDGDLPLDPLVPAVLSAAKDGAAVIYFLHLYFVPGAGLGVADFPHVLEGPRPGLLARLFGRGGEGAPDIACGTSMSTALEAARAG